MRVRCYSLVCVVFVSVLSAFSSLRFVLVPIPYSHATYNMNIAATTPNTAITSKRWNMRVLRSNLRVM